MLPWDRWIQAQRHAPVRSSLASVAIVYRPAPEGVNLDALIIQRFDHSAVAGPPLATHSGHPPQFVAQRLKTADPGFHISKLFARQRVRFGAGPVRIISEREQGANGVDGEPQLSSVLDERQAPNSFVAVYAAVALRPVWLRQKPNLLVETDRRNLHIREAGELADAECAVVHVRDYVLDPLAARGCRTALMTRISEDNSSPAAALNDAHRLMRRRAFAAISTVALILAAGLVAPAAHAQESEEPEVEEVIVQATRSGRRVQDEPIRVDVINREEIEEKIAMRPGNIAMMLSETGGLRVQVTSPGLGGSNVRVQGMRGRYTQFLTDGLPLSGGQASSLGLLQIPPTDLGQVEIIKGAASALYGPSALGGVINLVSRRPSVEPLGEVLANITSRGGQDLTAYGSAPLSEAWSQSIVAGGHHQNRKDLDGDGWADIAGYDRWTLRPRLFWEGADGATAFITLGAMGEQRRGGTLPGRTVPDGTEFPERQDSRRFDGGLVASRTIEGLGKVHLRASAVRQDHTHQFGAVIEDDRHDTVFSEISVARGDGATTWLAGLALQRDDYRSEAFPAFDYTYTVPAVFAQIEHELRDDLTLAGSARLDDHSEYGLRFSPRLSVLFRPGPWTVRSSIGRGFYAPNPFVEEIEASGLSRLEPLSGLKAEVAESASLEGGYAAGPWEANATLFASNIKDAVQLVDVNPTAPGGADRVRLANVEGVTRTRGAELLLRYRWDEITLTGSYVYVDATEPLPEGGRRAVPLTPQHTAGFVAMWEREDFGRVGFEAYYTGRQELEGNPYRARSKPYFELGLMAERRFGNVSVFLNLENLLDVRQTKHDRLVLPRRAPEGTWTVDAWGPTEGFVANGGVRIRFGGAG